MKMKRALVLEEQNSFTEEKVMEKANLLRGFKLSFLDKLSDGHEEVHRVEVKNVNIQDVMRHLQRGESVLITPKLQEDSLIAAKKQKDQAAWYFIHT
jgi:hypothetical protein